MQRFHTRAAGAAERSVKETTMPTASQPTDLQTATTATSGAPRRVRSISELPGPRALPVLGNLLQLNTGRMHTILSGWADEFGPLYRYRILNKNALVVSDAALINEVLRNRPEGFRRARRLQAIILELGVDGVFNAEGAEWRDSASSRCLR